CPRCSARCRTPAGARPDAARAAPPCRAAHRATGRVHPPRRRARPLRTGPRLPSRCGSGAPRMNCLLDLRIRAAAAEVSGHRVPDLVAARFGVGLDERCGRHDLPRCAEAALERIGAYERADEWMLTQAFDRRHLASFDAVDE